jgi:hypothetical protein
MTPERIGVAVAYVSPAAARIKFVMMSGCEIRETWLALTSIVFAPRSGRLGPPKSELNLGAAATWSRH